jgi:hypothetical protein
MELTAMVRAAGAGEPGASLKCAQLVGEIAQYKDIYRLCFLRGSEGIIIGLAEQLAAGRP